MILDAGPLIAFDRAEHKIQGYLTAALTRGEILRTSSPVVAQVWRDGARQARLARLLRPLAVHPFMADDARPVGELLRHSGGADVVDAHLVVLATQLGEDILTADVGDFAALVDTLAPGAPTVHHWD